MKPSRLALNFLPETIFQSRGFPLLETRSQSPQIWLTILLSIFPAVLPLKSSELGSRLRQVWDKPRWSKLEKLPFLIGCPSSFVMKNDESVSEKTCSKIIEFG